MVNYLGGSATFKETGTPVAPPPVQLPISPSWGQQSPALPQQQTGTTNPFNVGNDNRQQLPGYNPTPRSFGLPGNDQSQGGGQQQSGQIFNPWAQWGAMRFPQQQYGMQPYGQMQQFQQQPFQQWGQQFQQQQMQPPRMTFQMPYYSVGMPSQQMYGINV